jgi:hypothetical protein
MTLPTPPRLGRLRVQSVLYGNAPHRIRQAMVHLERAADLAVACGVAERVSLIYGDCSPSPVLEAEVASFQRAGSALASVGYRYFNANLGSARGHNRLLADGDADQDADYVLIMNPDIMVSPNLIVELARPFADARTGMVEAKQLPIEHPKQYDPSTGDTAWAATACTLVPAELIAQLEGFDEQTFFLYCDDVDFSWRVRLAGRRVIYQPGALAFHDKALGEKGAWIPGAAEQYFSAEAALLLAWKYSREDVVADTLRHFKASDLPHLRAAAGEFERRRDGGVLPEQIDAAGQVASFVQGAYTQHRFAL